MIRLKKSAEIVILRAGGKRLASVLEATAKLVRPGVTTGELNDYADNLIKALGDQPSFLHYQPAGAPRPYPAALCISVNDEVVHGIPSERVLKEGDVITLDGGLIHQKLFTDMAITVPVGPVSAVAAQLIKVTREALAVAIKAARAGGWTGDIGQAVSNYVQPYGYGVVRDLSGHGVGYAVHEEPFVPNYGKAGKGTKLKVGMVLAIEPMINLGGAEVKLLPDGFTYITTDGKMSAHFEHTVVITDNGAEILTQ